MSGLVVRVTGMAIAYEYMLEEGNTFSGKILMSPYFIQAQDLPLSLAKEMAEQVINKIVVKEQLEKGSFEVKFGERGNEVNMEEGEK